MDDIIKIKNCLISVSDKKNLVSFAKTLVKEGISLTSTGKTFKILKTNKIKSKKIENITDFTEILDGRVKTLHPKVFAGVLSDKNKKSHTEQLKKYKINRIEMIVINFYPFEKIVKEKKSDKDCIENIDIGGPSLVRAAAKNFASTVVVSDIKDYDTVKKQIKKFGGISLELRKSLAIKAFDKILEYDYSIASWFNKSSSKTNNKFLLMGNISHKLRYGENPHQKAEMYFRFGESQNHFYEKVCGKELSYNNLNDLKAAVKLLVEFKDPSVVIIKHAIPCGVSEANDLSRAWNRAYYADALSAFGGVVALNRKVDESIAVKMSKVFLEVVAAKKFTIKALKILSKKPNLRIIKLKNLKDFLLSKNREISVFPESFMLQDQDSLKINKNMLKTVSEKYPSKKQIEELLFAYKVVKHVKSNAIVISKNKTTVGIGSGNTSRIDSLKFAILKTSRQNKNISIAESKKLKDCVLASDAFFPFTDSIFLAKNAGIKSIIQPGGSINDQKVIDAVNRSNMSMVFTNKRCFSH